MTFNNNEAAVGTNKRYAAIHQFGGEILIPSRDRIMNFKKFRSGKRKGKVRFAKEKDANFSQKVLGKSYTIHMRHVRSLQ